MYAVIKAGGKQYRVAPNDVITVEKIAGEPGDIVEFAEVLLLSGDGGLEVGNPRLDGVTIAAEVLRQERGDTIIIFKKRRRHHYRRRNGHRQSLTALRITEILTGGRKPDRNSTRQAAPADRPAGEEQAVAAAGGAPKKSRAKSRPKTEE